MGILLKGGTIITATNTYKADLRIEDDKIVAIGKDIHKVEDEVFIVEGCFLFPGGIDPHTHFDLPVENTVTADDFSTGTKAALLGGTTMIIDYATQFRGETLREALANWLGKADGQCYSDYSFHMAITDWNEEVSREMALLVQEGVSSFKFYMAYKGTLQVNDGILLEAFRQSKKAHALICLHCENGDIISHLTQEARMSGKQSPSYHALTRPALAEREATSRALALAEATEAPVYIVHLTCEEALQEVIKSRTRGVRAFVETCPQFLLLDDSLYSEDKGFSAAKYVISPPLRKRTDQEALWMGLRSEIIDMMATDHCSFNFWGQKELGRDDFSKIPNGMPGVENRMGLLYTYGVASGILNLNQYVNLTSTQAAKIFGLYPQKGTIAVGSDADIVVWNSNTKSILSAKTQAQNVDYSPYEGFEQIGQVKDVFLRGRHVVENGSLKNVEPSGNYIARKPYFL